MEDPQIMEVDEMECDVCHERTFQEREGFYYCIECGTKKEQLRAVEICEEDSFNDASRHALQRSIKKPKVKQENTEITSWEFYNHVLRGFTQELLQMGAKPELKLMTLQVWAAYMARMEVAFNKEDEMGLPKLNVRALASDARIIYNHKKTKRKRAKLDKKLGNPTEDERANWREWRKTKRKLDESGFGEKNGANSDSTVPTANQSLKLQWSTNARKSLKKHMPLKHLDKHSLDSSGSMHCHNLNPRAYNLNFFDRNVYCLNFSKLFVVLAIALNLIEDDIQLTDLLRLIEEEHLTSRYMLNYLPENLAIDGKKLLKQMEMGHKGDKIRSNNMRIQISHMARFIGLNGFQEPNLKALTQRYVLELDLPPLMASYAISLIDVLPPTFEHGNSFWSPYKYPRYEARVMAYIVYVLKLMFGLDDIKERAISESAVLINKHLAETGNERGKPVAPLFVYTEWMQYVEMRKVLVSHYNESFAKQFGVCTQNGRKIDDYLNKERKQKEQDYNHKEMLMTPAMQRMRDNVCLIFETLLKKKYGETSTESATKDHIEFQPSLTPAHSYFQRILLHAAQASSGVMSVKIPDWMKVDHTEHQIAPFKYQTTELSQHLAVRGKTLRVEELSCQEDFQNIGIFSIKERPTHRRHMEIRANCETLTERWIEEHRRQNKQANLIFRQPVALYNKQYQKVILDKAARRTELEAHNPFWKIRNSPSYLLKLKNEEIPLNNLAAIQIFNEQNMDPLRVPLELPRRQMKLPGETLDPVEPKLETENAEPSGGDRDQNHVNELLLKISNFDCWLLHGHGRNISVRDKQKLRSLFPCSFRWLLETCAATINIGWYELYTQLLVLEVMFHHGIEDWSTHRNHLRLKYNILNKDINTLVKNYRDKW